MPAQETNVRCRDAQERVVPAHARFVDHVAVDCVLRRRCRSGQPGVGDRYLMDCCSNHLRPADNAATSDVDLVARVVHHGPRRTPTIADHRGRLRCHCRLRRRLTAWRQGLYLKYNVT